MEDTQANAGRWRESERDWRVGIRQAGSQGKAAGQQRCSQMNTGSEHTVGMGELTYPS